MKILKFYTDTCMPCRMIGKILESMNLAVDSINALENTALVDEYNVCTTPTLVFLGEDNKEVARTTGPVTKAQVQKIIDENS